MRFVNGSSKKHLHIGVGGGFGARKSLFKRGKKTTFHTKKETSMFGFDPRSTRSAAF